MVLGQSNVGRHIDKRRFNPGLTDATYRLLTIFIIRCWNIIYFFRFLLERFLNRYEFFLMETFRLIIQLSRMVSFVISSCLVASQ